MWAHLAPNLILGVCTWFKTRCSSYQLTSGFPYITKKLSDKKIDISEKIKASFGGLYFAEQSVVLDYLVILLWARAAWLLANWKRNSATRLEIARLLLSDAAAMPDFKSSSFELAGSVTLTLIMPAGLIVHWHISGKKLDWITWRRSRWNFILNPFERPKYYPTLPIIKRVDIPFSLNILPSVQPWLAKTILLMKLL